MRNILNIIILCTLSVLGFVACDNDSDDATPVVKYIRPTDAEACDSLLFEASMGQVIAIIGEDMQDVVAVFFNDQKAKLNPVYVTATSIIVTVPGSIPEEVTNTITLNTAGGKSVDYNFVTRITPPSVTSISCEWAATGSKAIIYGDYFFANSENTIEVLFPGNVYAEVTEFTDNAITVTVPDGTMKGTIVVANDYGSGKSSFTYLDDNGIFIDGENTAAWNGWGLSDFGSDEGLDGSYVKFEGSTGSWAWPASSIQLLYVNPNGAPLVDEGEISDYALKFECNVKEWHDTPMLIWFEAAAAHNVDGPEAQYHWKPYDINGISENFVTDGWITVTMPLSEFVYSKDETEDTRKINSLSELQNLNMMWFGAVNENSTEFGLNMWVDNIRLVKIK